MILLADDILTDEGSVVVFAGTDEARRRRLTFAVDHRCAEALAQTIAYTGEAAVEVERWQILGSAR